MMAVTGTPFLAMIHGDAKATLAYNPCAYIASVASPCGVRRTCRGRVKSDPFILRASVLMYRESFSPSGRCDGYPAFGVWAISMLRDHALLRRSYRNRDRTVSQSDGIRCRPLRTDAIQMDTTHARASPIEMYTGGVPA
jgi:hypothetical protein